MWPWDHLAFGYVLYTVWRRTVRWDPPDGVAIAILLLGTQLPDLLDKPLAWSLEVFPSGLSVGHSLVFLVAASAVATVVGIRIGRIDLSAAFAIGLISHLLGDILFAVLLDSPVTYELVLWPFVEIPPEHVDGLLTTTATLWTRYLDFLSTTTGRMYLFLDLLLLSVATASWLVDGAPGTVAFRRWLSND